MCAVVAAVQPQDAIIVDEALTSGGAYWDFSKVNPTLLGPVLRSCIWLAVCIWLGVCIWSAQVRTGSSSAEDTRLRPGIHCTGFWQSCA